MNHNSFPKEPNIHTPKPLQKSPFPNPCRASFCTLQDPTANPIKLETGLRPISAGIPYTLLLRIEAIGFPTFWLLLQGTSMGY